MTGSNIFDTQTQENNKRDEFIKSEVEIRKNGDIASIIRSLPNIDM